MRELRANDAESLSKKQLILMTLKKVGTHEPFYVADFNDIQVPIFTPTNSYIGWSAENCLKFGKGPAKMENGMWIIEEDEVATNKYRDFTLDPNLISMEMIK